MYKKDVDLTLMAGMNVGRPEYPLTMVKQKLLGDNGGRNEIERRLLSEQRTFSFQPGNFPPAGLHFRFGPRGITVYTTTFEPSPVFFSFLYLPNENPRKTCRPSFARTEPSPCLYLF